MERERRIKIMVIVALVVAVLGVSIGFAANSTELSISAQAAVNPAWSIEFLEGQGDSITIVSDGTTVKTVPEISSTEIRNINVEFSGSGNYFILFFKAKNKGSIPAEVSTITTSTPICTQGSEEENLFVCENVTVSLENTNYEYFEGGLNGLENDELAEPDFTNAVQEGNRVEAGDEQYLKLIIRYDGETPSQKVLIQDIDISIIYEQAD